MRDGGKYRQIWKRYLPVIKLLLKKVAETAQELKFYEHEFEAIANREKSGYTFNLEIVNGRATNDITGTAVARDLVYVVNDDKEISSWLKNRKIKISMGRAFTLQIVQLP